MGRIKIILILILGINSTKRKSAPLVLPLQCKAFIAHDMWTTDMMYMETPMDSFIIRGTLKW